MSYVKYVQEIWVTYLVKITENDLNCFKYNIFVLNFYLKIFVNI